VNSIVSAIEFVFCACIVASTGQVVHGHDEVGERMSETTGGFVAREAARQRRLRHDDVTTPAPEEA